MDASRVLLALREQVKWRERKGRLLERFRALESRRRYLSREIDVARKRIAELEGVLEELRLEQTGFGLRATGVHTMETRPLGLTLFR